MAFETIIGLEIHVELATESKIFCSCSTKFGASPNENTCPVCIGLPGTLPVLNEKAVNLAVKAGKALNCKINHRNKFDRKNYFYPDLPKAYQISQYDLPICVNGYIDMETEKGSKRVRITRIHIEEDAGKLIHLEDEPLTLVDYNRTGVPLIEIVTEPDLRSPEEAVDFLKTLKGILEYAEISDCKMEQGSLRCDANISIRETGKQELNTRVEIKNLNSFKEVLKALKKEEKRQTELYLFKESHKIVQETRKWDAAKGRTISMRSKEESHDYRYFPEPDILPVYIDESKTMEISDQLPELPKDRKMRLLKTYGIKEKQADILVSKKILADYFEAVASYGVDWTEATNWITGDLLRVLKDKETDCDEIPIKAEYLADLIKLIEKNVISRNAGKEIFERMCYEDADPEELAKAMGLSQISHEGELMEEIENILHSNTQAVEDYQNGKKEALGFLVGQVMRSTKGKANPQKTKELLEKLLQQYS